MQEINVTLETLFEVLRTEKKRGELQQLPRSFLAEVRAYLEHKQGIGGPDSEKQLENIHKILEELFNVRERKLLELVRSSGEAPEGLIDAESEFFTEAAGLLKKFRGNLQLQIKPGTQRIEETPQEEPSEKPVALQPPRVVFLSPVPRFVGRGLEVYGPFNTGDEAKLPDEIAELLIRRGRARKA